MPKHTVADKTFFLHNMQNVLLFSDASPIPLDFIQCIIQDIVKNKATYAIQDEELPFDVFVRENGTLMLYSFESTGALITEHPARALSDDGLFHFQFQCSDDAVETFRYKGDDLTIEQALPPLSDEPAAPFLEAQAALVNEIAAFTKTHFPGHFSLWSLNEDIDSKQVQEHFRALLSSLTQLYLTRDSHGELLAMNGISTTPDQQLAYQSLTVTHQAHQKQGFMARMLERATHDHPEAVITAYLVNPRIKDALGSASITRANEANAISGERSTYLKTVIEARGDDASSTLAPP